MEEVFTASVIWILTHLGLATNPLRGQLVALLSERVYLLVYSGVALLALANLIWVYTDVPRFDYQWMPNPDLYWVAKLSMPMATILLVGGFMVKNPTMVWMERVLDQESDPADLARGVTRISRHPFQWAVVIWALGHLVANGDWVSIIFFSSFVVVSGLGGWLMDRKKRASLGDAWQPYAAVTSNVPFVAILSGRNRLVLAELGLPVGLGLLVYVLLYYFHEALTGAVVN